MRFRDLKDYLDGLTPEELNQEIGGEERSYTESTLTEKFIKEFLGAKWTVSLPNPLEGNCGGGELGLEIMGVNLQYYKWPEPMIVVRQNGYDWRVADKREFGEVIHSPKKD